MPVTSRRAVLLFLVAVAPVVGCDGAAKAPGAAATPAEAAVLPPFQQEIASLKAEVTLPGVWKYGYRLVDKTDTTYGGYRAIEFHYVGDSARRVPPRLLLVIRVFKKAAWMKAQATQETVSRKLTEHAGDVYSFSIVTNNPYQTNSPPALRVDQMMLALTSVSSPFGITFK